jgi:ribonuclease P protein component
MLPRARRIDKTTFKTLNGRGMSYHSPLLFLSIYQQNKQVPSRFAVLVSKKVSALAVDRNRQRRRVYRSLQGLLPAIKPGYFGIVTLKKEGKEGTFAELDVFIKNLLKQAGLVD